MSVDQQRNTYGIINYLYYLYTIDAVDSYTDTRKPVWWIENVRNLVSHIKINNIISIRDFTLLQKNPSFLMTLNPNLRTNYILYPYWVWITTLSRVQKKWLINFLITKMTPKLKTISSIILQTILYSHMLEQPNYNMHQLHVFYHHHILMLQYKMSNIFKNTTSCDMRLDLTIEG